MASDGGRSSAGSDASRGRATRDRINHVPELRLVHRWSVARGRDKSAAPVLSPVTEKPIGEAPVASSADTEEALDSAARGFAAWKGKSAFERADALHRIADEMLHRADDAARMISTETGKPLAQADASGASPSTSFAGTRRRRGASMAAWSNRACRADVSRFCTSRSASLPPSPPGIPAALVARKVAPALAAGCAIVVRPSSQTPGTAMLMVDCMRAWRTCRPARSASSSGRPSDLQADHGLEGRAQSVADRVDTRWPADVRDAADTVKKVSMELGGTRL